MLESLTPRTPDHLQTPPTTQPRSTWVYLRLSCPQDVGPLARAPLEGALGWVSPEKAGPRRDSYLLGLWGQNAQVLQAQPRDSACPHATDKGKWPRHCLWGSPGNKVLSPSEPISALALEWCEWPSVCVCECVRMCAYVWWGRQRNLDLEERKIMWWRGVG